MRVADKMTRNPITLGENDSLRVAIEAMRSHHIRHLPVVREGRLVGIVTDRDVKRATPSIVSGVHKDEYDRTLDHTLVSQIMTRTPVTAIPNGTMRDAVGLLLKERIGALPVVRGDELVGILTETDCMRAYLDLLIEMETLLRRHFQE